MREYRFDVVRVVCMTYLVAFFHLSGYVYPNGLTGVCHSLSMALAHASLGLFTFVSGYLLGKKYKFGQYGDAGVWTFYKKRILRVFPLFVLASAALWLIGLNGARATLNGLLCISPFVNPVPMTLYYIPLILWCYLVTPLLSRNGLRWRVLCGLSVFALLVVARILFPSIDNRFVFNVSFYLAGIVSAPCFDWKFGSRYGKVFKSSAVLGFMVLVIAMLHSSVLKGAAGQMAMGALGVFVILFICEAISNLLFDNPITSQHGFKAIACRLVSLISYASMACYMFHRFFYWAAEKIWNSADATVKWFFMAGIVYPIILVLSYAIQKLYDNAVKRL